MSNTPAQQAYLDGLSHIDDLWRALSDEEQEQLSGRPRKMTKSYDNLPTWEELRDVRTWIMMGCPAAFRDLDPREMVKRLWKLMEGLPSHLPIYAWGAPEWRAERARLRGLEVSLERVMIEPEEKP